MGEGKPTSFVGLAPLPDRAQLHAHSVVSLYSDTRLLFVSRELTNIYSMGGHFETSSSHGYEIKSVKIAFHRFEGDFISHRFLLIGV